jgi:hypothetical protein
MPNQTRRCLHCDKAGAFSFNHLCSYHWDPLINFNIKKFVEEDKKKKETS